MIGVAVQPSQLSWVTEFFELFKTPWELMAPDRHYEALLIADGQTVPRNTRLALVYGAGRHPIDRELDVEARTTTALNAQTEVASIPVAGGLVGLAGNRQVTPITEHAYVAKWQGITVVRLGYDLFVEVANLLTRGQSVEHAEVPTLELHISVIRHHLRSEQIRFLEIPPRPYGHEFVCCLTHDIDFFGIRRHLADRTLAGFLLRATAGAAYDVIRGRKAVGQLRRNLVAVCSLPLVFAGLSRDFWQPFEDYAIADRGYPRTFFLVPRKAYAGRDPEDKVQRLRAVAYEASEIAAEIQAAAAPNTEFGVHGIDAWRDRTAGKREIATLAAAAGGEQHGVRMHWLYYAQETPRELEAAGFAYDSTWGYNDAIGYRAGTMQPFRLTGTSNLLELPLTIMDTAMLYPGRMALSSDEANARSSKVVCDARSHGGALVINWHDRSLAPERQWGGNYNFLLDQVNNANSWFATMKDAASWFRWRRSIRFERAPQMGSSVKINASAAPVGLPPARVAMHDSADSTITSFSGGAEYVQA